MPKNLIFTTRILTAQMTEEKEKAYRLCEITQRKYAERIGADFICQEGFELGLSGFGNDEKLNIFKHLDKYDRVLSLDADILIKPDAPNIFNIYTNPNLIYMLDESKHNVSMVIKDIVPWITKIKPDIRARVEEIVAQRKTISYFNVGVILASKPRQYIFDTKDYPTPPYWRADQDFVNWKLWQTYKTERDLRDIAGQLSIAFNGMFIYDVNAIHNCYFLHYAGNFHEKVFRHYVKFFGKEGVEIDEKYLIPQRIRTDEESEVGLYSLASVLNGNVHVGAETNSYSGESTEILAKVCDKLYAIESWNNEQIEREFDLRTSGLKGIEKTDTTSELAAKKITEPLDFVYLGRLETYERAKMLIGVWNAKVKSNGFVCGHNVGIPEVKKAIVEIFGEFDGTILHTFCDGSWMFHKGKS